MKTVFGTDTIGLCIFQEEATEDTARGGKKEKEEAKEE